MGPDQPARFSASMYEEREHTAPATPDRTRSAVQPAPSRSDTSRDSTLSQTHGIVHIGYPKTATTWFQTRFYPRVENHDYIPHRRVREAFLYAHAFRFEPHAARAQLGPNNGRPPILCEEELSGSCHTGGHMGALSKEFAARIHSVLPQARIVVLIRNQVDMIAAVYAQYVKRGGTHGARHFLFPGHYRKGPWRRPYKKPLFSFDHFEYIGLIRHYRQLFGADNVQIFAFEAFRQDSCGFVIDFARQLELSFNGDGIDFGLVNTSYRQRTLRIARIVNRFTCGNVVDKTCWIASNHHDRVQRGLEQFDRTRLAGRPLSAEALLGQDIVDFIRERYAESNRELARETGLPLGPLGYPGTASR